MQQYHRIGHVIEEEMKKNTQDQLYSAEIQSRERMIRSLKSELEEAKAENAKTTSFLELLVSQVRKLEDEKIAIRKELNSAIAAEEMSKKALDDMALALKEVATEAIQTKEALGVMRAELEHSKSEEDHLRATINDNDEKFRRILEEKKREVERYKNIGERLRLEVEETLIAFNEKEITLVECLKKSEEDRAIVQLENNRLFNLVHKDESKMMSSKEENGKLRDIMKQALSEANITKEALEIARLENSKLEEVILSLTRENDQYKIKEGTEMERESLDCDDQRSILEVSKGSENGRHGRMKTEFGFSNGGKDLEFDWENEKNSRKKRALLRRFGDLLIRKRSIQKKEGIVE